MVTSVSPRCAPAARNSSALEYADSTTPLGKLSSSARTADRNRSLSCRCVTLPTSATSVSARIARRSSGELDRLFALDTRLLHVEKPRPPGGQQRLESLSGRSADRENGERIRRVDRRRRVVAEKVHLGEDDAVRFFCQLGG